MIKDNCPIEIDVSAKLAELGVYIPNAKAVILETYWDDSGKHVGKPCNEWPSRVVYSLGDNETENLLLFASMLQNYSWQAAGSMWYSNRLSKWQISKMRYYYPHDNIIRENKS